jgi:predicted Zn finger-like uncharacterized protein
MAWMTCCPSCRTTFRVTPDELTQAQAWLRCGQCDRVFDSTGLVVNWTEPQSPEVVFQAEPSQEQTPTLAHAQTPGSQGVGLWAAALLLLCVLPVLLLMTQRQALLSRWPQLWPVWSQVCAMARCEVPSRVRVQDVVIDSSSFVPQTDGYALTAILRNEGAWPVRTPALELTLINQQDQAVLRRVFTSEQLQMMQTLAPEQTVQLRMDFSLGAQLPAVMGYRLRTVQP